MSFRTREDYLAASEELSPYYQTGSVDTCQTAEVDSWYQSLPLTPPDSASDCSTLDCPDMNASWSQASLLEDLWTTTRAPDESSLMPSTGSDWQDPRQPVTAQDLLTLDASTWLNVSSGPVDLGLSPVLSHESQNSHTLNSTSEPEVSFLASTSALSFMHEPSWDPSAPVVFTSSHLSPMSPEDERLGPFACQRHPDYYGRAGCAPQPQMPHYQKIAAPDPQRVFSDAPFAPKRPLLPRTESLAAQEARVQYPHTVIPSAAGAGERMSTSPARVSSMHGVGQGPPSPGHTPDSALASAVPYSLQTMPSCAPVPPRGDAIPLTGWPLPDVLDQSLSAVVRNVRDINVTNATTSYLNAAEASPIQTQTVLTGDLTSSPRLQEQADSARTEVPPSAVSGEAEEGRHRSHPLYNEGPQPDGLYHCPFTNDPNCQHSPTKLKCNYDKFIDSHLKPFRCKVEACSKQEFSSTACLLRHEREAHGMHGHGDRPHLCRYAGCERGVPGNGFPRRYNLFDHMRRVHDHKEMPSHGDGPDSQVSRKGNGRKRKSLSSTVEQSPAQRVKEEPTMSMPLEAFAQPPLTFSDRIAGPQGLDYLDQGIERPFFSQSFSQGGVFELHRGSTRTPEEQAGRSYSGRNVEWHGRIPQQAWRG